jgi:hypothetical protein
MVEHERSSEQVIELMDLISKADRIKASEDDEDDGPFGLNEK